PTLSKVDRQFELQAAQTHSEDPVLLNEAAWKVVRQPGGAKEAYALALRQAEAAVRADTEDADNLNTLGVARYRIGQCPEALIALSKSEKLKRAREGSHPADLAFLAMAHHQLSQKDEAKATLARLREVMKQPRWSNDVEAQSFVRE